MEYLWWLMVFSTMVVYPVVLVRAALKGRPWAMEALKAMRYLGGESMAWRSFPADPPARTPAGEPPAGTEAAEDGEEPGRLVA